MTLPSAAERTTKAKVNTEDAITWPRKLWVRRVLRFVGRTLMLIFTQAHVTGRHHFPRKGPAILVANHTALIEVLMMILYAPYPVEFITTGDIPLEPRIQFLANLYGFIPIKRGSMDRKALSRALSVLQQGGVIGIFPQGGIWNSTGDDARTGVAWLSSKGNAPVVPMGFGGSRGALANMMRLGRPRVTMNVGEPMPPISEVSTGAGGRKGALEEGARLVMARINALIPQEEKTAFRRVAEESHQLRLTYQPIGGEVVPPMGW